MGPNFSFILKNWLSDPGYFGFEIVIGMAHVIRGFPI